MKWLRWINKHGKANEVFMTIIDDITITIIIMRQQKYECRLSISRFSCIFFFILSFFSLPLSFTLNSIHSTFNMRTHLFYFRQFFSLFSFLVHTFSASFLISLIFCRSVADAAIHSYCSVTDFNYYDLH